jgi:fatty-acyl-CoA synthase
MSDDPDFGDTPMTSHVSGTSDKPLLGDTIGDDFDRTVAAHGWRDALVEHATGWRWTYAQLAGEVAAVALGLRELGVGKGDRVDIWALNCAEWTFTQYATAKLGAILVNINRPTGCTSWSTC